MAMNLNKVLIAGNMTRDVEVRFTGSGTAVGNMGLAINRRYKGKDGSVQEDTTFVDVTLWGKDAENAAEYLRKGSGVLVEGRLTLEEWDDKDSGKKRSKLTVTCERLQFGAKSDQQDDRQQSRGESQGRQRGQERPQPGRFDDTRVPTPGGGMFDTDGDDNGDSGILF